MTTSSLRRWVYTTLALAFLSPLSAFAQTAIDMSMSASDAPDPVVAGSGDGNLVHILSATNNDATATAAGVTVAVTPVLPDGVTPVSIVPDIGTFDENTFVWTIGDHPPGVTANLTITLTVGASTVAGTDVISATGTVSAVDNTDPVPGNDTAVDPTSVERSVDMLMAAADTPDPVVAGSGTGNLVHVLSATNNGPSDASGVSIAVAPVIPTGVSIDSISPDIGTWDINTLTWTIGTHPAGVTANLTITLTVGAATAVGTDVISATGTVSSTETDSNPDNNTAVDPTSVTRSATFDITKIWDGGEVDVQLTCGGILVDSATTSGLSASFTLADFADATDCTVTETVPTGYAPTYSAGCSASPVTSGQTYACDITNDTSLAGFTVTKTFSDSTTDDVEVSISCDDGFLNATTATIAGDGVDSFRFIATEFINGAMNCTISETSATEGYEQSDPCVFENVTAGEYACALENDAEPGTFSVTKTWDITGAGSQTVVDQDVTLVIDCESDVSSPEPLPCDSQPDSTQCVWNLDWDGLGLGDSVTASVEVDTADGDAFCTAYETNVDSSEVETTDDCEPRMLVEAAGSNGCEINNTVFFEGIPTLSQYGLALMALLMLGVGMVGFRRFA
ncbi:MAG: IPTL-CTERM sorting domain-containing protein [Xanthomonadales bacterium]|nr:IPTL-CTERM sorting domain-containing protein [Xanthomonadales bacterium]